ncbi:hypothetical protein BVRB_020590, partial [Beta vulgaris subsp. vulgaris]
MMLGRQPYDRQFTELRRRLNDVFDAFSDPLFSGSLAGTPGFGPGFAGGFGTFPTMLGTTSTLPLLSSTVSTPSTALSTGGAPLSQSSWLSPWTTGALSDVSVPIVDLPLDVSETDKEMTLKRSMCLAWINPTSISEFQVTYWRLNAIAKKKSQAGTNRT